LCLILFAYQVHPTYKLIVAANRDELYTRPTAPLHYWEDYPDILAGRDLSKMGTWIGVTQSGRFAALTNYRDPKEITEGKRSRGELVADFLKGRAAPEQYLLELAGKRHVYPGYNLLAGTANELYYYSNIENKVQKLEPGVYGVSNHLLDSDWPKVKHGKEGLSRIISGSNEFLTEQIFTFMQQAETVPDEILPNTGISIELERILSPIFIQSDGYGTRSSSVVLMSDEEIIFRERVYTTAGVSEVENSFYL
jgi:uncharacterized protein with NRDE domain